MAKDAISDRLLKRKQKDLSAWEVRYQRGLDERIAASGKDLKEIYRRTGNYIERRIEPLFKEYVRIKDIPGMEAKASGIMRKMEHLNSVGGDITKDLDVLKGKIQPYYTQGIGDEFRRSYYEQGFGLSKASGVAVNVPLLTDSHILGVIANPWIENGANYAARIGRNTDHLAAAMKNVITQATVEGFGWSEGARRIQEATGEAYNAAVTLFRTEMNRASSLASSYSGMKNADILDGKRWNATLDKFTAPRDAANEDLPPFDLDYGTPENPGVPGIRIPNHPNCRCKWTMILSALGINTKGRIARLDGERSYTDAGTYREWADEVGLPDLDERLERDNLKSYLRPGESLDDLNKRVVKRRHPAGTVTVNRAPWDTPPGSPPPKIAPIEEVNETLGEVKEGFKPAKSIKEANAWAAKNLNVDHVNYKDFDIRLANDVNREMQQLQKAYPEVKDTKWITTSQARDKAVYDRRYKEIYDQYEPKYGHETAARTAKKYTKRHKSSGEYASSTNKSWGAQEGVCFNRKYSKDYDLYLSDKQRGLSSGWSSTGTPSGTVVHEFGHQLDNFLDSSNQRGWIDDMFHEFKQDVANHSVRTGGRFAAGQAEILSQYANTNSKEFFSEAFAEAILSDNPRPTAVKVMERLEIELESIRSRR